MCEVSISELLCSFLTCGWLLKRSLQKKAEEVQPSTRTEDLEIILGAAKVEL